MSCSPRVQQHGGLRDGQHGGQPPEIEQVARVGSDEHGLVIELPDAVGGVAVDPFVDRGVHTSSFRLTVREEMIGPFLSALA